MFAVLVPIFVAMMAFVLNVGKTYFEHAGAQQTAESVMRTVNAIVRDGADGDIISDSDIPSNVKTYSTYEALVEKYPDARNPLNDLEAAIGILNEAADVDIEQSFVVDGDESLYCRFVVAGIYRIMKFEKEKNKITGLFIESDPEALTAQLLNADITTKNAIINKLVNPLTDEQKNSRIEILSDFLSNVVDSETKEENKSAVVLALLNAKECFSEDEEGAILDAYLSGKLSDEQLNNPSVVTTKVNALSNVPNIDVTAAMKILEFVLNVQPNVSNVNPKVDGNRIFYEDSMLAKRYRRISVKDLSALNSVSVLNEGKTEPYE